MSEPIVPAVPSRTLGSRIVRGVASSFVIGVATNGFIFIGSLMIPRLLTRAEYAQYTVSISFVAIVALLADLGMNPFFTKLFAEADEAARSGKADRRGVILGSALALRAVMSVVVSVLVVSIGSMLYSAPMVSNMAILLISLIISSRLFIVRSVGESVLRSEGKYYIVATFALIDSIAFTVLLLIGRERGLHLSDVIWIYTLCSLPGFLLLTASLVQWLRQNNLKLQVSFSFIRTMMRMSLPLTLGTVFLTIHTQIDNLLLDKLSTSFEVSSYAATVRLFTAVAPISLVIAAVTAPELTRLLHRGDHARSIRLTDLSLRLMLVLAVAIALTLTAASMDLVHLLLGDKYASSGPLLAWTGWMLIPMFTATFLMEASVAAGKFWIPAIYSAIIMVTVIIGDLVLIPAFGAAGAMGAKLIALTLGCAVLVWLLRKSDYMDARLFGASFIRLAGAAASGLIGIWLLRGYQVNDWLMSAIVLVTFFFAVHATRLLHLNEVVALIRRFRMPTTDSPIQV